MQTKNPGNKVDRRNFLRTFSVAAGTAATVSGPLLDRAEADGAPKDEKRKARYQPNSPDIQAYYRVNRYPTK